MMKNLLSFMFGAALSAGAITLLALYDDKHSSLSSSNKDDTKDEDLDEEIKNTERETEEIAQLRISHDE